MSILITGGAGYIGSHMSHVLVDRGEQVIVVDNLSTGTRSLASSGAKFIIGDAGNQSLLHHVIRRFCVDSIIHFAGSAVVPESVSDPLRYYTNNTETSRRLIETCVREGVRHFLFSSSAAVYGKQSNLCVSEAAQLAPVSPYGRSKLMTEWMLADTARAHGDFRYVALRYFNVAGADMLGRAGQSTPGATHLVKRICQVALGRAPYVELFGTDYATPDGTAIRDYIHVVDVVDAHVLALDALRSGACSMSYNCGYGRGFSVRELLAEAGRITGKCLPIRIRPRRAGDAEALVADARLLRSNLLWRPRHDNLETIINSALEWEQRLCA